jgi:hypothetical protein
MQVSLHVVHNRCGRDSEGSRDPRARPCGRTTKRTYCHRRRPPAAPDTGRQSPVQQGTVDGSGGAEPVQQLSTYVLVRYAVITEHTDDCHVLHREWNLSHNFLLCSIQSYTASGESPQSAVVAYSRDFGLDVFTARASSESGPNPKETGCWVCSAYRLIWV